MPFATELMCSADSSLIFGTCAPLSRACLGDAVESVRGDTLNFIAVGCISGLQAASMSRWQKRSRVAAPAELTVKNKVLASKRAKTRASAKWSGRVLASRSRSRSPRRARCPSRCSNMSDSGFILAVRSTGQECGVPPGGLPPNSLPLQLRRVSSTNSSARILRLIHYTGSAHVWRNRQKTDWHA